MRFIARIVITARTPEPPKPEPGDPRFPILNGIAPSWRDVRVALVTNDGERIEFSAVKSVSFFGQDSPEALTARLEVYPDAIELEAIADVVVVPRGPEGKP